jgi:hypothetical protein
MTRWEAICAGLGTVGGLLISAVGLLLKGRLLSARADSISVKAMEDVVNVLRSEITRVREESREEARLRDEASMRRYSALKEQNTGQQAEIDRLSKAHLGCEEKHTALEMEVKAQRRHIIAGEEERALQARELTELRNKVAAAAAVNPSGSTS